jgi:hypothetical protein
MTTKISIDRIKQIIREEAARANTRWYMVNEKAPVEEEEVIVELLDEEEEVSTTDAVSGKGLYKGRILQGRVSGAEYRVVSSDRPGGWDDIGEVEVVVHKYPKKKSLEGEYTFKLSKIDKGHELYKNAVAAYEEIPEPPSDATAASDAPPEDLTRPERKVDGTETGFGRGETYLTKDGERMEEKEFGFYKMKKMIRVGEGADGRAKWLARGQQADDGNAHKRKDNDAVTHVRVVFHDKQVLSVENIENEDLVKEIQFKLWRKGVGTSKDYKGNSQKARELAAWMLRSVDSPLKEKEADAEEAAPSDEGTLSESWKRIIG